MIGKRNCARLVGAALLALAPALRAQDVDIPFQKYTLPNGLTLIVHEDHKAPIVALNVWYHVASKNEKPGKTGFAHLFEHLMFNGSEHFKGEYFEPFEQVGATDMNGTTNNDRTNYFENVPTSALDLALWMESERMGYMVNAITQATLDEQRGVVQNEKRQGDNQPYGKTDYLITSATYPAGHPYSWTVIGSMEDLSAASLDDVKDWFRTYYGAGNAVLVVAGDVKPDEVREKVGRYFADVPPGPPIQKYQAWPAKMTGVHRASMQDRVPQARIYKVWNVPEWGNADADYLDLVSDVLGSGKTSRLYRRLVYRDQTATSATAYVDQREIGGQFYIDVMLKPGADVAAVEKACDEELATFLAKGPTPEEVDQVRTRYRANFVRGIERIGGFGGKSDVLAQSMVYGGRPDFYKLKLDRVARMTPADLLGAAQRWLSDGELVLTVTPYPQLAQAAPPAVDRSKLPAVAPPPRAGFASLESATLSNGLKVLLARRTAVPVVQLDLLVDAGYAADRGSPAGTGSLTMDALDEGTRTRDALRLADELAAIGGRLSTGSDLDASSVELSVLKENLDRGLGLFADVALNPVFPQNEVDRLKKERLARIQQEKTAPFAMALRVLPRLLYGPEHAYGNPLTGTGTEASLQAITRADLVRFHQAWFKPNHATLIVVGDVTLDEIRPKLEALFRGWAPGDIPAKKLATAAEPASSIYLLDRPGSDQSVIIAGNLAPPRANPQEPAIETLNDLLGGAFGSRINMNLREDKHWSYGASSFVWPARGQRPFVVFTSVQPDKTRESIQELEKELRGIFGARPVTGDEIAKSKHNLTLSLPGRWETGGAVANDVGDIVRYGLSPDYFDRYAERVNALTPADIQGAASILVHPDHMVWIVVGDRQKIEPALRTLNLGPLHYIDSDGKPQGPAT